MIRKGLKRLPFFLLARDMLREWRTLSGVARPLMRPGRVKTVLANPAPEHPPGRFTVPRASSLGSLDGFSAWLSRRGSLPQGADSLYLTPKAWRASPLAEIAKRYPADCGLKISKNLGDVSTPYMTARPGRRLQRRLAGTHLAQMKTFAFLHARGLAPRLWDILELVDGAGCVRVCYVVEHVSGRAPSAAEFASVVAQLQELCAEEQTTLVSGSGWKGRDFQLPDGNGNVIRSRADGRLLYVDVHSFRVLEPDVDQRRVA